MYLTFCIPLVLNIPSRFSSNSEAFASELFENLEGMFANYYLYIVISLACFREHELLT